MSEVLENPLILKFCSKSLSFLKVKQFVNEMYDHEFTGKVKIEDREDEEETLAMVIEDYDSVGEKNWRKSGRYF